MGTSSSFQTVLELEGEEGRRQVTRINTKERKSIRSCPSTTTKNRKASTPEKQKKPRKNLKEKEE